MPPCFFCRLTFWNHSHKCSHFKWLCPFSFSHSSVLPAYLQHINWLLLSVRCQTLRVLMGLALRWALHFHCLFSPWQHTVLAPFHKRGRGSSQETYLPLIRDGVQSPDSVCWTAMPFPLILPAQACAWHLYSTRQNKALARSPMPWAGLLSLYHCSRCLEWKDSLRHDHLL